MNEPRSAFTCRQCAQDVPAGVGHACGLSQPHDRVVMDFITHQLGGPMSQQEQQGMLIPLPSFEQRVEMALARLESRLTRVETMDAARIEDLHQQLAEEAAYIKRLEEHIKALGSSLPNRPA